MAPEHIEPDIRRRITSAGCDPLCAQVLLRVIQGVLEVKYQRHLNNRIGQQPSTVVFPWETPTDPLLKGLYRSNMDAISDTPPSMRTSRGTKVSCEFRTWASNNNMWSWICAIDFSNKDRKTSPLYKELRSRILLHKGRIRTPFFAVDVAPVVDENLKLILSQLPRSAPSGDTSDDSGDSVDDDDSLPVGEEEKKTQGDLGIYSRVTKWWNVWRQLDQDGLYRIEHKISTSNKRIQTPIGIRHVREGYTTYLSMERGMFEFSVTFLMHPMLGTSPNLARVFHMLLRADPQPWQSLLPFIPVFIPHTCGSRK